MMNKGECEICLKNWKIPRPGHFNPSQFVCTMKQASFPAPRGAVAQSVVLSSLVNFAVSAVIHQPTHVWLAATLSNKMHK